jgi:rhodanese-related sulfurtransferase
MEPVTNKLRRTRLFANLPEDGLIELIERPGIMRGNAEEPVEASPGDLVVLLEGGLAMTSHDGGDHLAAFSVEEGAREPAILYTIPRGARLMLTEPSVFLVIDGERLDALLSDTHETHGLAALDDDARGRIAALLKAAPFKAMRLEHLVRCAEAMEEQPASAGEDVVREGEAGDYFYVLESGAADVWRSYNGATPAIVANLGPGATFGEEALLQEATRNATVRMREDGKLLRLAKSEFDRLLKSQLLNVMTPNEVMRRLKENSLELVDCRTEEEWELCRLPNSRLMPLETLRERAGGLDKTREYLVYCRSGRRSSAAAFLMRQMGLKAHFMGGGITHWPYEVEGEAVDS